MGGEIDYPLAIWMAAIMVLFLIMVAIAVWDAWIKPRLRRSRIKDTKPEG